MKSKDPSPPDLERPAKPASGHVYVENITVESLARVLSRSPRGVLMIRDELTGWVLSLNQYRSGRGADRQIFLSIWSGEPTKIDRKSELDEPLIVTDPFVSRHRLHPAGQARRAGRRQRRRGRLHPPDPLRLPEARDRADLGLGGDRARDPASCGATRSRRSTAWRWIGTSTAIRRRGSSSWRPRPAGSGRTGTTTTWRRPSRRTSRTRWSAPGPSWWPTRSRLALIVHLLRAACGEPLPDEVDAESLDRAFRLIAYFKSHARAVYDLLQRPGKKQGRIQKALAWIRAHDKAEFKPSDLARNQVAGIRTKSEAEAVMKELADLGYGRLETAAGEEPPEGHLVHHPARPVGSGWVRLGGPTQLDDRRKSPTRNRLRNRDGVQLGNWVCRRGRAERVAGRCAAGDRDRERSRGREEEQYYNIIHDINIC